MCRKIVFQTESGIGLWLFQMKDFLPSVWMETAVVNCFVEDVLCNTEYDDVARMEKFKSAMFLVWMMSIPSRKRHHTKWVFAMRHMETWFGETD
ncbi:hypothetical protein HanPI659440_Chr05g0210451 [Helianthus annuus]|nr:hypothetical protein HanPI659440_Chr05g0210451 [Helianthus annuus]